MKALKITILLVLGSLLLLFACTAQQPNKPIITGPIVESTPNTLYTEYDCWESPFNPHEILDTWPKLNIYPTRTRMVIVIAGNPKINWQTDYTPGLPFTSVPVPEGELTSVIIFVFAIMDAETIELIVFGYKDKNGYDSAYKLDVDTKCYILDAEALQSARLQNPTK